KVSIFSFFSFLPFSLFFVRALGYATRKLLQYGKNEIAALCPSPASQICGRSTKVVPDWKTAHEDQ
ncbi:MAG TPA: hypothetical protein VE133_04875, partial [Candidatus Sulfotelmatobacter sp.]|nr:hypothetical protein [Candidatus Sulfotelmatobacter sp.]